MLRLSLIELFLSADMSELEAAVSENKLDLDLSGLPTLVSAIKKKEKQEDRKDIGYSHTSGIWEFCDKVDALTMIGGVLLANYIYT